MIADVEEAAVGTAASVSSWCRTWSAWCENRRLTPTARAVYTTLSCLTLDSRSFTLEDLIKHVVVGAVVGAIRWLIERALRALTEPPTV